jgi:hypothetical protein
VKKGEKKIMKNMNVMIMEIGNQEKKHEKENNKEEKEKMKTTKEDGDAGQRKEPSKYKNK